MLTRRNARTRARRWSRARSAAIGWSVRDIKPRLIWSDVTVIARQTLPFAKQFGDQIGRYFYQLHQQNGVKWVQGEIEALLGDQQVSSVQLKGGRQLAASVVLFATGVEPATDFIHDLPLAEDGSLQADEQLQVADTIWVAGDIATYPSAQGPLRIEHYRIAHQQGQTAAWNMLDQTIAFDRVPFFWTTSMAPVMSTWATPQNGIHSSCSARWRIKSL